MLKKLFAQAAMFALVFSLAPTASADVLPVNLNDACDPRLPATQFRTCIRKEKIRLRGNVNRRLSRDINASWNNFAGCGRSQGNRAFRQCIIEKKRKARNYVTRAARGHITDRSGRLNKIRKIRRGGDKRPTRVRRAVRNKYARKKAIKRSCRTKETAQERRQCLVDYRSKVLGRAN